MGLLEGRLQPGDHVFVLAGNIHPLILRALRRYADTWQAVGECFLFPFMDGMGLDNRDTFDAQFDRISSREDVRAIKGKERNPRWSEVEEQAGGPWRWPLIEWNTRRYSLKRTSRMLLSEKILLSGCR